MNTKELLLSKNYLVLKENKTSKRTNNLSVAKILLSFSKLNYTLDKKSIDLLSNQAEGVLNNFYLENLKLLKSAAGYKISESVVLFRDFTEADLCSDERKVMQFMHYFSTYGAETLGLQDFPMYVPETKESTSTKKVEERTIKMTVLHVLSEKEALTVTKQYLCDMLEQPRAISYNDRATIKEIIYENDIQLENINFQFKENFIIYLNILKDKYIDVDSFLSNEKLSFLKTVNDYLRLYRNLSDSEAVMFNTKIKYKSISRFGRKWFLSRLNEICKNNIFAIDDFAAHYFDWILVFEKLHPGEYKQYKYIYDIAKKLRNKDYQTFNSSVVSAIESKNFKEACFKLSVKPGEFARKLNWLLCSADTEEQENDILSSFAKVANKVSVPVLIQLYNYFLSRTKNSDYRIFSINTETGINKIFATENNLKILNKNLIEKVLNVISDAIRSIKTDSLGKVYLSESMSKYALPGNDRNGSESFKAIPKGSKIDVDLKDKQIIRLFTYWKNAKIDGYEERIDNDLSIIITDDNFNVLVTYGWNTYFNSRGYSKILKFSGDVTNAPLPNGASEYIDIDLKLLKEKEPKARFILAINNSYTGISFDNYECYTGIMVRNNLGSENEIFNPQTVLTKFRLTSRSVENVNSMYDICTNQLMIVDSNIPVNDCVSVSSNEVELLPFYLGKLTAPHISMYDLVKMENNRYELVDKKENADLVIDDTEDADIRPYDQEKFSKIFM